MKLQLPETVPTLIAVWMATYDTPLDLPRASSDLRPETAVASSTIISLQEFSRLFQSIGWSASDAAVYRCILNAGVKDLNSLASDLALPGPSVLQSVERLKEHVLVALDSVRGKEVVFAIAPEIAWPAVANATAWNLATSLRDFDVTANKRTLSTALTPKGVSKEIHDALLQIAELARGSYREPEAFTCHQWRQTLSGDETAALLVHTLKGAKNQIRAVSHGSRLPHVAQVWQTLVHRMAEGVAYERIVDFREIVEHGLFIVERDILDAGVNLWLLEDSALKHSYYLVDNRFVVVLYKTGANNAQIVGRFTRQPDIVRRFRKRFPQYRGQALPGLFALGQYRRAAAEILERASIRGFSNEEVSWLECLVNWGVFCHAPAPSQTVRERGISQGFLGTATNGRTIINYGLQVADLRRSWNELSSTEKTKYEYNDKRNARQGHHHTVQAS